MNKKELKEKIENVHKNKYIYQRYNGLITKYIDKGDYYINCDTGIAIEKNEHLLLGKVSENIIDLIEIKDIVNDCIVIGFGYECVNENKERSVLVEGKYTKVNYALLDFDIKTILTKELYEANCYKVGGLYGRNQ